jgi:hypothetical protein
VTEQPDAETPQTAGELRQRLAEMGDPWTVDPRLEDGDPLPEYGRGGEPPDHDPALARALAPERSVSEELRGEPPSNPLMRRRWVELGLLEEE